MLGFEPRLYERGTSVKTQSLSKLRLKDVVRSYIHSYALVLILKDLRKGGIYAAPP